MLQPLMGMGHIAVLRNISFKKCFGFFYLPNTQPGISVDSMLKKNRHVVDPKNYEVRYLKRSKKVFAVYLHVL